eukprot:gnl/Spiro4/1309_TR701_c0_g1_i1.p1 gnl/Spiro4/1309_TR701_c0_g1~~gnl/Spiro4/1309_TR701_c0_g1_i1.p1  ORF type:complete len:223 (-),score=66.00 gnl/Spiro4/1309_TR701_c0_g1_i1:100-726(-)
MVFYFTAVTTAGVAHHVYMGRDKEENEELIRHAFPEDVWFHVDNLSSAHVYLRLLPGESIHNIPPELLTQCAQLCKANSIQGNKRDNIHVVYTLTSNLKKSGAMDVGQVGFHVEREVFRTFVPTRLREVVRAVEKTRREVNVDLAAMRAEHDAEERARDRAFRQQMRERELRQKEDHQRQSELRNYTSLMKEEKMQSNRVAADDDDFM